MIDIETTGVNREKDSILEVALVEIEMVDKYWRPTWREFHMTLHYAGSPENEFAKKHMSELYKKCNETDKRENYSSLRHDLQKYIHADGEINTPKFFMGWNASNFDLPFIFEKKILNPSHYDQVNGKEELRGDVHYRIYEQTGALNLLVNMTGLSRSLVQDLAEELNPVPLKLPKGKQHDALVDCYSQINMMNGLIEIGRRGIMK